MKKISILLLLILMLAFFGCSTETVDKDDDRYIMNGSIAYGTAENSGLEKTKIDYTMTITGSKEDINNIEANSL